MLDNINILGYEYDIRYTTGEEIKAEMQDEYEEYSEDDKFDGSIDYGEQIIRLHERLRHLPVEKHLEVLVHECIHAIDEKMQIGLVERDVELLGNGLAPVILQLIQGAEQPRYLMAEEERAERLKALDERIGYKQLSVDERTKKGIELRENMERAMCESSGVPKQVMKLDGTKVYVE